MRKKALKEQFVLVCFFAVVILVVILAACFNDEQERQNRMTLIVPSHRDDRGKGIGEHYLLFKPHECDGHAGYIVHHVPKIPEVYCATRIECVARHYDFLVSATKQIPEYYEYYQRDWYLGTFVPSKQAGQEVRWQNFRPQCDDNGVSRDPSQLSRDHYSIDRYRDYWVRTHSKVSCNRRYVDCFDGAMFKGTFVFGTDSSKRLSEEEVLQIYVD